MILGGMKATRLVPQTVTCSSRWHQCCQARIALLAWESSYKNYSAAPSASSTTAKNSFILVLGPTDQDNTVITTSYHSLKSVLAAPLNGPSTKNEQNHRKESWLPAPAGDRDSHSGAVPQETASQVAKKLPFCHIQKMALGKHTWSHPFVRAANTASPYPALCPPPGNLLSFPNRCYCSGVSSAFSSWHKNRNKS